MFSGGERRACSWMVSLAASWLELQDHCQAKCQSEWHWPGHVCMTLLFPRLISLYPAPQQFTSCSWNRRESQRDKFCSLPTLPYSPSTWPQEHLLLWQFQPWSGLSLVDVDIWTNKQRVWSWLLMSLQFGFLWRVCTNVMVGITLLLNNHNHIEGWENRTNLQEDPPPPDSCGLASVQASLPNPLLGVVTPVSICPPSENACDHSLLPAQENCH